MRLSTRYIHKQWDASSMPSESRRPATQADYRSWRPHATALLERQGLSLGIMRERDLRRLYTRGKSPEDAGREVEAVYWNARVPLARLRRKQ
jgi:hypothetical protein